MWDAKGAGQPLSQGPFPIQLITFDFGGFTVVSGARTKHGATSDKISIFSELKLLVGAIANTPHNHDNREE